MSDQERTLLLMRGLIAGLPEDKQQLVRERAEQLRTVVGKNDEIGMMAFALLGAEFAAS